jgi:hypothetical protein
MLAYKLLMKTQNLLPVLTGILFFLWSSSQLQAQPADTAALKRDALVNKYESRGFELLTNLETDWIYQKASHGYVISFIWYGKTNEKSGRRREKTITLIINPAGRVISKEKRTFIYMNSDSII